MTTMLFKHPGQHMQDGVSYEYLIVEDDAIDEGVAAGWSRSVPEAKAAADATQVQAQEQADSAPPTREELEAKAKDLDIKFDGRTSDKKLADAIAEKLKG